MDRSLGEEHWARDFEDAELFEREVDAELWDRHFDEETLAAREREPTPPPRPRPPRITVVSPTPPPTPENSPARHRKWKRESLYDDLVARERPGRDAHPRPRPRPAPVTITVEPPTPPASGENSPARHRKWKREALYDALVARMHSIIDELD